MRDFTLDIYKKLCESLLFNNYTIVPVRDYIKKDYQSKCAIIRHDVDKLPSNALEMAKIENSLGIKSTYYFRTTKNVFNKEIISLISSLGHEIGFHYEVLAKSNGNMKKAIIMFEKELIKFREIINIETIVMHGSPLSKWRDSDLWETNNYLDYGIIGEAYLSLDYNRIYYYSDTGRSWYDSKSNIRDRPDKKVNLVHEKVRSTEQLISILPKLGKDLALNIHPQRWHNYLFPWTVEFFSQNIKNIGKSIINLSRGN